MEMIDTYIDRKFGRAEVEYLHPSLTEVLTERVRELVAEQVEEPASWRGRWACRA